MEDNERIYMWSWVDVGTGENSGASSLTMIAMKEFGEVGQYTHEEVILLNRIKNEIPCPQWLEHKWMPEGKSTIEKNREMANEYNEKIMSRFRELTDINEDTNETI